jgi:hypothetical protein
LKEKLSKIKNTNFYFFRVSLFSFFLLRKFFLVYFFYKKKFGLFSLAEKPIFERVVFLKMWKTGIISLISLSASIRLRPHHQDVVLRRDKVLRRDTAKRFDFVIREAVSSAGTLSRRCGAVRVQKSGLDFSAGTKSSRCSALRMDGWIKVELLCGVLRRDTAKRTSSTGTPRSGRPPRRTSASRCPGGGPSPGGAENTKISPFFVPKVCKKMQNPEKQIKSK